MQWPTLLSLVSRALEAVHNIPLRGMEEVWHAEAATPDMWHRETQAEVQAWRRFVGATVSSRVYSKERAEVWDGQEYLPLAHGSFAGQPRGAFLTMLWQNSIEIF